MRRPTEFRVAIRVDDLGKKYQLAEGHNRDSLYDGIREALRLKKPPALRTPTDLWALRHVTFDVPEGEVLGVIGRNGSGKSTLMKILARISMPTEGRAEIDGHVGALLEVGTGFHPELTGRENIELSGAILGMSKRDIQAVYDRIVDFSEIGQFLDMPVKHYSSGMFLRLAFSVSAHMSAPIMLLDEVLSVGDAAFQAKCRQKIREIAADGRTVLIVSHDMSSIAKMCNRVLVLEAGAVRFIGSPGEATRVYLDDLLGPVAPSGNG